MEGGVRTPPNRCRRPRPRTGSRNFNGGRRAHAAESERTARRARRLCDFNGGRRAHAAECSGTSPRTTRGSTSMEGGVRTPPNATSRQAIRGEAWDFNGGRRAHAAESGEVARADLEPPTSMEGGVRTPPNSSSSGVSPATGRLQWRAACARRRIADDTPDLVTSITLQWRAACARRRMSRRPPSERTKSLLQWRAACARRRIRGPTRGTHIFRDFNGGRRAHAAESLSSALRSAVSWVLQWRAACARRRIRPARRGR